MKPGRDLDARVAEIFGYEEEVQNYREMLEKAKAAAPITKPPMPKDGDVYEPDMTQPHFRTADPFTAYLVMPNIPFITKPMPPFYSTNSNEFDELMENLTGLDMVFTLSYDQSNKNRWMASIEDAKADVCICVKGESVMHVLCLLILKCNEELT